MDGIVIQQSGLVDGLVVADKSVAKRRLAHDELAALPAPVVEAAV